MNTKKYGHFSLSKKHILLREDKTPVLTGFSKAHKSDFAVNLFHNSILLSNAGSCQFKNIPNNHPKEEPLETDTLFLGALLLEYYTGYELPEIGCQLPSNFDSENYDIEKLLLESEKVKGNEKVKSLIRMMLSSDPFQRGNVNTLVAHPYIR